MRAFLTGLFLATGLLSAFPASAAQDHPFATRTGFPQDTTDLRADPAVQYGTLPNGLRYAILKNDTPRERISIRVRFGVGSLMEAEDQRGIAHFLEHMAFNGSENIPEGEMIKILEREGLAFGPDTNAYTSFDETVYLLDMPKSEQLGLGLRIMRETASRLLLNPTAIDKERGVILSEERTRDTPGLRQALAYYSLIADGSLLPKRFPIGSRDVISSAPREAFARLYRDWYRPDRTFVVVVGDIDPATVEREIETQFGDWKAAGPAPTLPNLGTINVKPGSVRIHIEEQGTSIIRLVQSQSYQHRPDSRAKREEDLALALAGAVINRRLERLTRIPNAPFISASVSTGDLYRLTSFAEASAVIEPGKWQPALKALDEEVRRALQYGFTADEIAPEIANFRQSYANQAAQAATRQTAGLASRLVGAFSDESVFTSPADELALFEAASARFTPEALLAAARKAWGNATPSVFMTTSAPVEGGEAAIATALSDVRKVAVSPPEQKAAIVWGYGDFGPAGKIEERSRLEDLDVTQVRFANNVRVNFKKTDFEQKRVRVNVRIGEGLLALPPTPGLSRLIGATFIPGGVGKHDTDELERALAGRTVGRSFSVGADAFSFGAATTPEDLQLQLQLFAAYVTDAAWRPDGDLRYRALKDTIYRQATSSTSAVLGSNLGAVLRSNDPRYAFPTPAQFDAVTLADAKAILTPLLASGAIEITIVGDVDEGAALSAVASTFGALSSRPAAPDPRSEVRAAIFPAGKPTALLEHKARADQSIATIFWPMRDYGDGAEVRALRILEGVFQLRLTEIIREERGATYSPGTSWFASTVSPGYGYLGAFVEVKPDEIEDTIRIVEALAAELAAGKIDEDLFVRARTPLLAEVTRNLRDNGFWIGSLTGISHDPQRLVSLRNVKQHYEGATLEQIRTLAARYFVPEKAFEVRVVPGPEATAAPAQ